MTTQHDDRFARLAIDRAYRAMAAEDSEALALAASCLRGQLDHLATLSPRMVATVRYTLNTVRAFEVSP